MNMTGMLMFFAHGRKASCYKYYKHLEQIVFNASPDEEWQILDTYVFLA